MRQCRWVIGVLALGMCTAILGCDRAARRTHPLASLDTVRFVGISGPHWGNPAVRAAARGAAGDSLRSARDRWEKAAIDFYRYREELRCFCTPPAPIIVEVRHGVVASVTDTLGNPAPDYAGEKRGGVTIPEWFAQIHRMLADTSIGVRVAFHPALGYPLRVFTDSPTMSDVHVEHRIVWFEALAPVEP